jgi:hypothetical protein
MQASLPEAVSLLDKWFSEGWAIACSLCTEGFGVVFLGVITRPEVETFLVRQISESRILLADSPRGTQMRHKLYVAAGLALCLSSALETVRKLAMSSNFGLKRRKRMMDFVVISVS